MKMKAVLLVALVGAIALAAIAQNADIANFEVYDGDAWLIESFGSVWIYAIDPETGERIDAEVPNASLSFPDDPILLILEPGFYEFVVGMYFISEEVVYFQFEIVEEELTVVDLRELELPEALATY